MNQLLKILILVCGLAIVGSMVFLMIKRKISERNSLLWIFGAFIILILSIVPGSLDKMAAILGIDYPPALLFLFSILILFFIVLYQSIQISILNDQLKELTQNVAINRFRENEKKENHENIEDLMKLSTQLIEISKNMKINAAPEGNNQELTKIKSADRDI